MENPYNKINPLSFPVRFVASVEEQSIFVIEAKEHSAFDMCVFRQYLFDFLSETMRNAFDLRNSQNDFHLVVANGVDVALLRDNLRVI